MQCNMLEAKSQLSRLVQAALAGEDVVIANKGVPVVRLVKVSQSPSSRRPGAWSALPKADEDWDSAQTNAVLAEELSAGNLL